MNADDVRRTAWAMPLTSPSYPRGPYRFVNREFLVISYRTDPAALAALVPEPLFRLATWCASSSSACPTRPASATTPKAGR